MSAEENKAAARRFFVDAFGEGKLEVLDEILAADAVAHDPANPQYTGGSESAKGLVSMYRSAFPDLRFEIDDMISEGDMVATRWTASGTHEGDLPDIPATGRRSTVSGITIDRFEGGKVTESWTNWDTLGMLQQLGVIPAPETAEA
ncbi:MAG: ester cyclase [Rubrobacteraceae bacterium]